MDDKIYYLIYRQEDDTNNFTFHSWTSNKFIAKAFLTQRNPKKFRLIKVRRNEFNKLSNQISDIEIRMIDYLKIASSKTGEFITLFISKEDLRETEIKIQRLFSSKCNFKLNFHKEEITYMANLYLNLKKEYIEALDIIGYHPEEISELFPNCNDWEEIAVDQIENIYSFLFNGTNYEHTDYIPGILGLSTVASKIIYSLESIVKVMKDDF